MARKHCTLKELKQKRFQRGGVKLVCSICTSASPRARLPRLRRLAAAWQPPSLAPLFAWVLTLVRKFAVVRISTANTLALVVPRRVIAVDVVHARK